MLAVMVALVAGAIGSPRCGRGGDPNTRRVHDLDARFPVRPSDDGILEPNVLQAASLPSTSPDSRPHKRPRGIDQRRSIVASQAWAPLSSIVTANIAGSIDLIDQPSTKAARSSACDTRRGPQSPGWRSLKHIR